MLLMIIRSEEIALGTKSTQCDQIRLDVKIFDRGLYALGMRGWADECKSNYSAEMCSTLREYNLVGLINSKLSTKPIYITEEDPSIKDYFCLVRFYEIYRILPMIECQKN